MTPKKPFPLPVVAVLTLVGLLVPLCPSARIGPQAAYAANPGGLTNEAGLLDGALAAGRGNTVPITAEWHVCPDGPPTCDFDSVQVAVDSAGDQDLIKVATGIYSDVHARPSPAGYIGPGIITQVLYISKTLTIQGGYTTTNWTTPDPETNPTILDAQGQGRVLFVANAVNPTIEGLGLTGGDATGLGGYQLYDQAGGGVFVFDAAPVLSGNVIYSNTAGIRGAGGGVYLYRDRGTLQGNTIVANYAGADGGGLNLWLSSGTMADNLITANTAYTWGGGIFMADSPILMERNWYEANYAKFGGGVSLTGSDGAILRENTIVSHTNIAAAGMYFGYTGWTTRALVISNTFAYNESYIGSGVYIMYGPSDFIGNDISHNLAYFDAGGLYAFSSEALFEGNLFSYNQAFSTGGGLYLEYSLATMRENTFARNLAQNGAGAWLYSCDTAMYDDHYEENSATDVGGGLVLWYSPSPLDGGTFVSNTAASGGGLAVIETDHAAISNTRIAESTASYGGGVLLYSSSARLVNTIIAANEAGLAGPGLLVADSTAHLLHSTIADNYGAENSGVLVTTWDALSSQAAMTNTILAGHTLGITVSAGCSATLEATLWENQTNWAGAGSITTGTVNLWGSPVFLDPLGGDYHIAPDSPAIDAGVDAGISIDIDGDPRPYAGGYDLGADEAITTSCIPIAEVTFMPTETTLFAPTTFTAVISPENATEPIAYVWDFGDGSPLVTGPQVIHAFDCGVEPVTLTATNDCSQQVISQVVQVDAPPCCIEPEAGFTYSLPLFVGVPITFTNVTTWCTFYPITYTWSFGDGTPPVTAIHPAHIYTAAGTYTVQMTASLYCGCDSWVYGYYSDTLTLDEPGIAYRTYLPVVFKE
jgi:PKD repeat protein